MTNTNFNGDIQVLNDSITVLLESSSITKNTARTKNSIGLGLYGERVDVSITNSLLTNHDRDGLRIHADSVTINSEEIILSNNGEDGVHIRGYLN